MDPLTVEGISYITRASYALSAGRDFSGTEFSLSLELRKLGFLRQNLIFSGLHTGHVCPCRGVRYNLIRELP
jgi:hypothetical protein